MADFFICEEEDLPLIWNILNCTAGKVGHFLPILSSNELTTLLRSPHEPSGKFCISLELDISFPAYSMGLNGGKHEIQLLMNNGRCKIKYVFRLEQK